MAREVWYITQDSGNNKGGRFKNADLAHARILVTFPTCHPQWSSEPQAHHKQVTLQKWRPGTPGRGLSRGETPQRFPSKREKLK